MTSKNEGVPSLSHTIRLEIPDFFPLRTISVGEIIVIPAISGFAREALLLAFLRVRMVSLPTVTSTGIAANETEAKTKIIRIVKINKTLSFFIHTSLRIKELYLKIYNSQSSNKNCHCEWNEAISPFLKRLPRSKRPRNDRRNR